MPTSYALTLTASDLTSQGTLNNLKALDAPDASGTQGNMTLSGGQAASVAMYTEPGVPGLTQWPAGDYTHSCDIDATGADITYTFSIRRVNSSGVLQQTLGTSSPQSGTGFKTFTVNIGSPITTNAGDRLVGVLTGSRGASHGNQTLTASFNGVNDLLIGAWTVAAPEHATSGALAGAGSSIAGSASSATTRPSSGVLSTAGAAISGTAARTRAHATTGALTGQAAAVAGTSARTRAHPSSGVLATAGAEIVGAAAREGAPAVHATSGALATLGGEIAGAAARTRVHATDGALAGQGAAVSGDAARQGSATEHTTSGALGAAGAAVAGEAARMRAHATQGELAASGAALDGAAARVGVPVAHATSGTLTGGGSIVIGFASGPLIDESTLNAFVEMPLPRIPFHHKTSGRLVGKGASMSGIARVTRTGQNRMALLMISV